MWIWIALPLTLILTICGVISIYKGDRELSFRLLIIALVLNQTY